MKERNQDVLGKATEPIRFDRLALAITRPVYWDIEPEPHARGLATFLRLLLTAGGLCVLGKVTEAKETEWLPPETALKWVQETEESFVQLARLIRERSGSAAFPYFIQRRCWLFFDHECLLSALERALDTSAWQGKDIAPDIPYLTRVLERHNIMPPDLKVAIQQHIESGQQLYFSFSVDFATSRGNLIFAPQLIIWNYWPAERRYAQPSISPTPPPALEASQAAEVLEGLIWHKAETAFAALRQEFRIGYSEPEMAKLEAAPPVFYFAAPVDECIPQTPETYFTETWLPDLQRLVKKHLGSDDPLSQEISGALLEGELLVLRREMVVERKATARYYLILPCAAQPYEGWEEVERDLAFVADKLAFLEFTIADEARDLITDLMPLKTMIALWAGSADDVAAITTDFLRQIAVAPSPRRRYAYERIALLRGRLALMASEMMRKTADVLALSGRRSGYIDGTADFIRRAFTVRTLREVRSLIDALADAYPYTYLKEPVTGVAKQASDLRETFGGVIKSIEDILEREEWEARARQEKANFRLTIVIAALTIATVLPSLIDLSLPDSWPYIRQLVTIFRVFIIGAAVVTGWVILQPWLDRLRLWLSEKISPPAIRRLGEQVCHVWRLVELAKPQAMRLWKLIGEGGTSSDAATSLRAELEVLDAEACRHLLSLWKELQQWMGAEEQPLHISPQQRMRQLAQRTERFMILSMLLDDRSYPTFLPRVLTLFRYRSTDFVSSTVVDDYEFDMVFRAIGYKSEEIRDIEQWCEEHAREFTVEQFVEELQEMGIGAGRLGVPPVQGE